MSVPPDAGRLGRERTRAEIIEVAARLLRAGGSRAVTTRAVAHGAGVQAPTIYRLFDDKDGLLDAVAEHAFTTYVSGKVLAEVTEDPVVDLRAGWETHIEFGLANPELFAILVDPRRAAGSRSAADGIEVLRGRVRRVAAAGKLKVSEARAVAMSHAAGTGVVIATVSVAPNDRDLGVADAVFNALCHAIITDDPVAPDVSPTTLAVALRTTIPAVAALSDAERALLAEWLDRISNS